MIKTTIQNMGEINPKDLAEYFLKIGGKTEDEKTFKGPYWEIIIGPETWTKYSSLKIQHILITFNIEEDKFESFMDAFNLNFLRCGG
ncbi:MAG: hypothetical protein ACERLG_05480 [Sedimentibacter sp.]